MHVLLFFVSTVHVISFLFFILKCLSVELSCGSYQKTVFIAVWSVASKFMCFDVVRVS